MLRIAVVILSILAILLGGLWLLQGSGLVQVRPILCFADCKPLQGASLVWAIVGAIVLAAGGFGVTWARQRRTASRETVSPDPEK